MAASGVNIVKRESLSLHARCDPTWTRPCRGSRLCRAAGEAGSLTVSGAVGMERKGGAEWV